LLEVLLAEDNRYSRGLHLQYRHPSLDSLIARHRSTVNGSCHPLRKRFTGRTQFIMLPRMEDPMPIRGNTAIPLREVTVRASRSSGPGGQHANKTSTRIEASFDVAASEALTPEQKQRIITRLGPRVTTVAQDGRSQSRNRELALARLAQRLASALVVGRPRRATRPSSGAVKRRLAAKRRQSERKRDRRAPADGD
jgi:ribosome-associated protein